MAKPKSSEPLQDHCRSLPGTTEAVKWGENLVFSVAGNKMYAVFDTDDQAQFSFKCDDDDFDTLADIEGIIPAPYLARAGWVKVQRKGALPQAKAKRLITKSHGLVVAKLSKKLQQEIAAASD